MLKKIRHSISLQIAKYNHVFCRDNDEYSRGIIAGLELVEQILDECETAPKTPEGAGTAINSESSKSLCDYCGRRSGCQARAIVHNFISSCDGYTKA